MSKYDDIVNYNYCGSNRINKLSMNKRAAQFSPFAALTGYEDKINESNVIYDKKIILDEEEKELLDIKINSIKKNDNIKVVYFNLLKYNKGKYVSRNVVVKKIDFINRKLILNDMSRINIDDIISIDLIL